MRCIAVTVFFFLSAAHLSIALIHYCCDLCKRCYRCLTISPSPPSLLPSSILGVQTRLESAPNPFLLLSAPVLRYPPLACVTSKGTGCRCNSSNVHEIKAQNVIPFYDALERAKKPLRPSIPSNCKECAFFLSLQGHLTRLSFRLPVYVCAFLFVS